MEDTPVSTDLEKARYFIMNTNQALDEITQSEDAEFQLEFISLMVNGGSVGEMADLMAQISEEMSREYIQAVESQIVNMETASKSTRTALSSEDVRNLRLGFYGIGNTYSARISLNQGSMNAYYGFCAATIAGLSAYRWCAWWQPWVGIAGLVTAGAASMTIELGMWYLCTDFKNLVNNIYAAKESNDALATINSLFQSGTGEFCYKLSWQLQGLPDLLLR
jgi:hypothetical protein